MTFGGRTRGTGRASGLGEGIVAYPPPVPIETEPEPGPVEFTYDSTKRQSSNYQGYSYCTEADTFNSGASLIGRPDSLSVINFHVPCYVGSHDQVNHISRRIGNHTVYDIDDEPVPFVGAVAIRAKAMWHVAAGSTFDVEVYLVPHPTFGILTNGQCLAEPDQWDMGTYLGTLGFSTTYTDSGYNICDSEREIVLPGGLSHGMLRFQDANESTTDRWGDLLNPAKAYPTKASVIINADQGATLYYTA